MEFLGWVLFWNHSCDWVVGPQPTCVSAVAKIPSANSGSTSKDYATKTIIWSETKTSIHSSKTQMSEVVGTLFALKVGLHPGTFVLLHSSTLAPSSAGTTCKGNILIFNSQAGSKLLICIFTFYGYESQLNSVFPILCLISLFSRIIRIQQLAL